MVSSCSQTSLLRQVVHTFIAEKEMVAKSLETILSTFVVAVELLAGNIVAEELLVGHTVELEVNRNIELLDLR